MSELKTLSAVMPTEPGPVSCPDKYCGGQVVERDIAVRWNPLEAVEDGSGGVHLWTSTDGSSDWETDPDLPFMCDTCLSPVEWADGNPEIEYD